MNILNLFSSKRDNNSIKLAKSKKGDDWVVKKGYSILYIGSKEKCKTFMEHSLTA
ncbi:MAG: hypothetical protein AB8B73_11300 [Ekhidna sp.]